MSSMSETRRLNVMIVEDDKLQSLGLEQTLEEMGHRVVATAHAMASAIQALDRVGPIVDVVLLDVSLAGELTTQLAARLDECSIRYVAVTGFRSRDLPGLGFSCPVLEKPFGCDELEACLGQLPNRDGPQGRSATLFNSAGCKPA